jgi:hypothetical protein
VITEHLDYHDALIRAYAARHDFTISYLRYNEYTDLWVLWGNRNGHTLSVREPRVLDVIRRIKEAA